MNAFLNAIADALERAAEWCKLEAARQDAANEPHLRVVDEPEPEQAGGIVDEPEPEPVDEQAAAMERSRVEAQSVSEAIALSEKEL